MEPSCLGRWSLLVRMAFALGGRKERVYRPPLVPLPMPWHPLLLTDSLPGALSSTEAHSPLHGAARSTRESTRPGEYSASDDLEQVDKYTQFLPLSGSKILRHDLHQHCSIEI